MNIAYFTHSLASCWNHGNAHFLRGVLRRTDGARHRVAVYEPVDAWSRTNLVAEHGSARSPGSRPPTRSCAAHALPSRPGPGSRCSRRPTWSWCTSGTTRAGQAHRAAAPPRRDGSRCCFTTRIIARSPTRGAWPPTTCELRRRAGVRQRDRRNLSRRRAGRERACAWHEAADTACSSRCAARARQGDLVWIGNWGDEERSEELHEYPAASRCRRSACGRDVHGVRYPQEAMRALAAAGVEYAGWLPTPKCRPCSRRYRVTVHVPRRPYAVALPGIPTIRVFEALACGIPLVCAPWDDCEGLFRPGDRLPDRPPTARR